MVLKEIVGKSYLIITFMSMLPRNKLQYVYKNFKQSSLEKVREASTLLAEKIM